MEPAKAHLMIMTRHQVSEKGDQREPSHMARVASLTMFLDHIDNTI
jgi:hypothetical protein